MSFKLRHRPPSNAIPDDIATWLNYDAESGAFTWAKGVGRRIKSGIPAGSLKPCGGGTYLQIRLGGRGYLAHRVAWFIVTGEQPPPVIDHKDGNGLNNSWLNLREATTRQNGQNRRQQGKSRKGTHCFNGRWQAYIKADGKKRHLGCFDTEEEAHAAYLEAARHYFGEFARAA